MPFNSAAESFHTQKLCRRLSSRKAQFFLRKMEKNSLLRSPLRVRGNARCSSWAHWKARRRLPISHIELFLLGAFILTDRQTDNLDSDTVRMLRSRTVKMNDAASNVMSSGKQQCLKSVTSHVVNGIHKYATHIMI